MLVLYNEAFEKEKKKRKKERNVHRTIIIVSANDKRKRRRRRVKKDTRVGKPENNASIDTLESNRRLDIDMDPARQRSMIYMRIIEHQCRLHDNRCICICRFNNLAIPFVHIC